MRKLVDAVGEILENEGHSKLGVNHIANVAGVSKKLIYRYFTSVDNLIETYIREKDYWGQRMLSGFRNLHVDIADGKKEMMWPILKDLIEHFEEYSETQKIILWQVSERNKVLKESHRVRETLLSEVFSITDQTLSDLPVDLQAIFALILGGLHYLHLHEKSNGETWCKLNINNPEDKQRIQNGVKTIIELCHREAGKGSESRPKLLKIKGGSGF